MLDYEKDSMRFGNMGIFRNIKCCEKRTRPHNRFNPRKTYPRPKTPVAYQMPFLPRFMS